MLNLKMMISACVLFVVSLALPVGNAFATTCSLPCSFPIPAECEETGESASFMNYPSSPNSYSGAVCHFNTNFKFTVTTSSFGTTTASYWFYNISGAYNGTFVSGHPHYKIKFENELDPNNTSFNAVFIMLDFTNDGISTMQEVHIEGFDVNDNPIYSETVTPTNAAAPYASFTVKAAVNTTTSQISYIHISTADRKFGLISVDFTGM